VVIYLQIKGSDIETEWLQLVSVPNGLRELSAAKILRRSDQTVQFRGTWSTVLDQSMNATLVYSATEGDELAFELAGDRFAINMTRHTFSGVLEITIDEAVNKLIDLYAIWWDWTPTVLMLQGLGEGIHKIRIRIVGKNAMSQASQCWLRSLFVPPASIPSILPETSGFSETAPDWSTVHDCINILTRQDRNVGDQRSAPVLYFDFLSDTPQAGIFDWHPRLNPSFSSRMTFSNDLETKNVIIGGGGLLGTEYFKIALEFLQWASRRKVVLWGVGHNSPDRLQWTPDFNGYDFSAMNYELIGVRDWGTRFRWVPCASCMAPELSADFEITREFGFYLHAVAEDTRHRIVSENPGVPVLDNFVDFGDAVRFIGESETLITNSFHGVYWATLMKRNVIGLPTSSKFFSLKHPAPLAESGDWRSALPFVHTYSEALEECRASNWDFARDVYQALTD
jgi:hypothetical protein